MSKRIDSPIPEFPGYIVLPDSLILPRVMLFDEKYAESTALPVTRRAYVALAGIIACIDEWHIDGQPENPTPDTFVFSPYQPASALFSWLSECVLSLVVGEKEIPNASTPPPSDTQGATATNQTN